MHDLDPRHGAADNLFVGDAAEDHLGAPLPQLLRLQPFLVVEGHHLVPHVEQAPDERLAREARTPGDQNPHEPSFSSRSSRSIRRTTGDPSARSAVCHPDSEKLLTPTWRINPRC